MGPEATREILVDDELTDGLFDVDETDRNGVWGNWSIFGDVCGC